MRCFISFISMLFNHFYILILSSTSFSRLCIKRSIKENTVTCIFVLTIFILISCASPTEPMEDAIKAEPLSSKLKISNTSNRTIFPVFRNAAP